MAEAYPQLQASQNFLQLQADLVDTEDKIQASRRFYNGGVRELNTKIKVFPNNLFARSLGFNEREFFEVDRPAPRSPSPRASSSRPAPDVHRDRAQQAQHRLHPARLHPVLAGRGGPRGLADGQQLVGDGISSCSFATGYATFQYFFADREAIA